MFAVRLLILLKVLLAQGAPSDVKIVGGDFHDFNGLKFTRDTATIVGGEFHDFGDIKGRERRDQVTIKVGDFHDFGDIKGRERRDQVTIKGGDFHDFGDIKGRERRDQVTIKGGDFHDFGDIKGKRSAEEREGRACRYSGGDFSGLPESERAKIKANCKVVGGDFGDDRQARKVTDKTSEEEGAFENLRKLFNGTKPEESEDLKEKDDIKEIDGGSHELKGKGKGSLSDITGAKDHLIKDGEFADFGDIKGRK